jgi:hypothetical protein
MNLNTQSAANAIQEANSRIDADIESVRSMAARIERTTERIIRHARALGYYQPTPETKTDAPTPVITTLADALSAMDRAIDHCSGSLNVFD